VIPQLDVVHNLPIKLPPKSRMKNRYFPSSGSLQSHSNAINWRFWQYWVNSICEYILSGYLHLEAKGRAQRNATV
jgi:hypothetical protein